MKNSIYNKKEVPNMHPGCSMAETGAADYDDFDNPLEALNIIPESKEMLLEKKVDSYEYDGEKHEDVSYALPSEILDPSQVREEFCITIHVPAGVHPLTYLKEIGVDITKEWVFLHEDVVDVLRKLPCKYHQKTVAYGEFFRFENLDEVSLQEVKHFADWKVILEGKLMDEEFYRPERPETIIEVVMK